MGQYINPGIDKFRKSLNSEIYVDKTNLIKKTNAVFDSEDQFICISRPRRFGKTMAANMLATYYGIGEDASCLFKDLDITNHPSFEAHLNKYNVIMVNMQEFLSQSDTAVGMLIYLRAQLIEELQKIRKTILAKTLQPLRLKIRKSLQNDDDYNNKKNNTKVFMKLMKDTYRKTKIPFVILIDEWDCIFRASKFNDDDHEIYLDFLRLWLKDQSYVGLAYMTGILPIKKYGNHSALNMFEEYSMTDPSQFLDYFGFKEDEVKELTIKYKSDMSEMEKWYNGYFVDLGTPIYNPKSVTSSLKRGRFSSYWNRTETYEALKDYILMDFDGLNDKITQMISGYNVTVNPNKFTNDMNTFNSADDVLTLLVHLGYLTYNFEKSKVRIPNEEVKGEFINSIEDLAEWEFVVAAIQKSYQLLQAIWNKEASVVAACVQMVHEQNTSILKYNDENSLSCIISLAMYSANNYYTVIRELPAGKGYSDLVFIPRKNHLDKPAMIVELKWNQTASGAISQIKKKNYLSALESYQGNLLLVGINYDKETKDHECIIESWSYC